MTQKERMLAELPYKAWEDGLTESRIANKLRCQEYNTLRADDFKRKDELIRQVLGKTGKKLWVESPFYCDYGENIEVGDNFYANFNCTILDVAKVTIGDNVMFAPNVSLYTAGHPLHHEPRNSGYEYGIGITIGNNVWICGNTVVNPGVSIGDNTVIGSGSVVTKDIPANAVAAGNPCRVIRKITDEERKYYYKNREFEEF
ncbi:MAG: sugar O-acetyltransferase [Oscillospiraceae bacterium]|nr:sugar O-acetyltransferase [Oscillospiraceae bacterium]